MTSTYEYTLPTQSKNSLLLNMSLNASNFIFLEMKYRGFTSTLLKESRRYK